MNIPKITIIILNWNGKDDTLSCLSSVANISYPNYELLLVDNGSSDGSIDAICSLFPDVHLIQTGQNLGFAEGNNVGIRHALSNGSNYILILNNDTTVDPQLLNYLIAAAKKHPNAGLIGPKIYYHSQPDVIWSAGGYWDDKQKCFEQTGDGETDEGQYDIQKPSEFIVGCAMFIPAEVFRTIGLLDSDYFLNYEEIDFQCRVRAAGYTILYEPHAHIWHKIAASFGGDSSPLKYYFIFRNRLLWAQRHLPWNKKLAVFWSVHYGLFKQFYRPFIKQIRNNFSLKNIYWAYTSASSNPLFKARAIGIIDYWKNNLGNCPDQIHTLNRIWVKLQK
ncbi:MAG: glycosyltransferase family 2 protein [Candidatus Reddybacter sp.]